MVDIRPQDIVTTGGTQSRVSLSEETVAAYAEAMTNGAVLPPIVVYHDGSTYWLADGFHRLMGHIRNGADWITADVRLGTRLEAVLHSVGANDTHGLRRSNADKRHSVLLVLNEEAWAGWNNCEIARVCAVNESTVRRIRDESSSVLPKMPAERKVERNGTTYMQDTTNIGKRDTGKVMSDGRRLVLPAGRETGEVRAEQIAELSRDGNNVDQIANEIGLTVERVRELARVHGIQLADSALRYNRRIDNRRVVEQTVMSIDACTQSINVVPVDFSGLESRDLQDWLSVVSESLAILRKFHARLKEAANV